MLTERITDDEIEFMSGLYDPIALSEMLFPNFDNPTDFDPDKLGHVRLGQFPLLSYEYLIDVNPELSEKENFELKAGAASIWCFAGRNFGKCSYSNDLCLLSDGIQTKFKDVIGTTQKVISLNQETLKLEEAEASFSDNGEKECLRITLQSGKEITITLNHPLLTPNGWVIAEKLNNFNLVASRSNYDIIVEKIIGSDIHWDKIIKIENVGKLPTVAVEVPKNQNYIQNDIISHNTMIVEKLDIVLSLLLNDGMDMLITSFDEIHIAGVLDWVRDSFDSHPLLKDFKTSIKQKPYLIRTKNNSSILGVNMALSSRNPGCFDKETEILTDSGWKYFYNLDYSDKVLSLNPETDQAIFSPIKKIIKEIYNGNLKSLNNKDCEFLLTSNHNIFYNDDGYKFNWIDSGGLPELIKIPSSLKWEGFSKEDLKFLGVDDLEELIFKKSDIKDVKYNDLVYCVETDPYHTIYVRRNGKCMWSGNSAFFQKHSKKIYVEEGSAETEEVYKKRIGSRHEIGCIANGSKILLPNYTTKNIEDINVGDEVLGWDEKRSAITRATVLNNIDQGIKDIVKIGSDKPGGLWLTSDHKILIKTPGEGKFRWTDAIRCEVTNFKARIFPYIEDYQEYLKGLLIGFIDSDGSIRTDKLKHGFNFQFSISQRNEVKLLEHIFEKLGIKYSKDEGHSPWSKHIIYNYRIMREHNKFILESFLRLCDNKSISYGYVNGFIFGDGWLERRYDFCITQSEQKQRQKDNLNKVLNSLDIPYYFLDRKARGKKSIPAKAFHWEIGKWYLPFYGYESEKSRKWNNNILNMEHKRFYIPFDRLKLKGFKEKQPVRDLTTTSGNFIVNGIIVHNCIERVSGMTDFTRYSPAGQKFYDPKLKPRVMNLPQFINPNFGEKEMKEEIKKYGGESSQEFKIYVNGEICEDGVSYFDMNRVKQCYNEDKVIKNFEITRKNYEDFRQILIIERPKNCECLHIASDIGDGGSPSEVIIFSKVNEKYYYIYSISLYNLTDEEQYEVFKWLGEELSANFISLDTSDGAGRSIFRRLEKVFPKENLNYVHFGEKIDVDIQLDDNGNPDFDKEGDPIYQREYVSEWSVKYLRDLFYDEKISMPLDYSFDEQVNKVVKISTGNRVIFKCLSSKNHIFQAFQCFAIAAFINQFNLNVKPVKTKTFCKEGA